MVLKLKRERPMLTMTEVDAIRLSWLAIASDRERAGRMFYETLFRVAPETRQLFTSPPEVQGRKLMETLAIVVESLDNMERIVPMLRDLGRLHVRIGVRAEQYDVVGAILLKTLRKIGGEAVDTQAEVAWRKAYGEVARIMSGGGP